MLTKGKMDRQHKHYLDLKKSSVGEREGEAERRLT